MSATSRPRVAMLVNGDAASPMGERARAFAERLAADFDVRIVLREGDKRRAIATMLRTLGAWRPHAVYVLDIAYSGIIAATLWKLRARTPVVVDTGDAIVPLARAMGERGWLGMLATRALDRVAMRIADHVVCRGSKHVPLLRRAGAANVTVIQDGVDAASFANGDGLGTRRALGIPADAFVVGVLGSVSWSERYGRAYGSELVEVLSAVRDRGMWALLVGDGDGLPRLRQRAEEAGVADRLVFAGRQPYDRLADFLAAADAWVSTQTNDEAGQVRTTGKLPVYLASGRLVLATDVGEASLVLPESARIPYHGSNDPEYGRRLAARVDALRRTPDVVRAEGERNRALAQRSFEYDVLAPRVAGVLHDVLGRATSGTGQAPEVGAGGKGSP